MGWGRVAGALVAVAMGACSSGKPGLASPGTDGGDAVPELVRDSVFAVVDVNVVPMDTERVLLHQTLVVRKGRIAALGPSATTPPPPGATIIEGGDHYLMPGLADMHVHLSVDDVEVYVRHGITTVRNMWGWPGLAGIVEAVRSGELAGPTILSTSPGLDGTPAKWPFTQVVMDPAKADSVVEAQRRAGWTTLKLYTDLRPDVYDSIVSAARRRGMDYVGHVPARVPVEHVIASGQRSIEHLGGYQLVTDPDRLAVLIDQTADAGTWNCPTLAIQLEVGPARAQRRRGIVMALHRVGAPLLVGTDSGIGVTMPGTSIHRELAELVRAGLTPFEALAGATRDAARFLGQEGEFGEVRLGLRADLVLVAGNPLSDVGALDARIGVMLRGNWLPLIPAGA